MNNTLKYYNIKFRCEFLTPHPSIVIGADLVDPKSRIEIGDMIKLSDFEDNPFNQDISDTSVMVTKIQKTEYVTSIGCYVGIQ